MPVFNRKVKNAQTSGTIAEELRKRRNPQQQSARDSVRVTRDTPPVPGRITNPAGAIVSVPRFKGAGGGLADGILGGQFGNNPGVGGKRPPVVPSTPAAAPAPYTFSTTAQPNINYAPGIGGKRRPPVSPVTGYNAGALFYNEVYKNYQWEDKPYLVDKSNPTLAAQSFVQQQTSPNLFNPQPTPPGGKKNPRTFEPLGLKNDILSGNLPQQITPIDARALGFTPSDMVKTGYAIDPATRNYVLGGAPTGGAGTGFNPSNPSGNPGGWWLRRNKKGQLVWKLNRNPEQWGNLYARRAEQQAQTQETTLAQYGLISYSWRLATG